MIETLALWTGIVVWLLIVIYVVPLLPYITITLCGVLVERIGQRFTDTYLTGENRGERLEEISQLHDEGYWRVTVSLRISRTKQRLFDVAEWYADVIDAYYQRLPLV